MVDEKDLEIARLRGQLEATSRSRKFNPVHFLAWLAIVALAGFVALVAIGSALPTPSPKERADAIVARCERAAGGLTDDAYNACMIRELQKDAQRYD